MVARTAYGGRQRRLARRVMSSLTLMVPAESRYVPKATHQITVASVNIRARTAGRRQVAAKDNARGGRRFGPSGKHAGDSRCEDPILATRSFAKASPHRLADDC
jgi:hypothetical protein